MHFDADRATEAPGEPSLAEMTTKAIEMLSTGTGRVISCWSKAAASITVITPATPIAR